MHAKPKTHPKRSKSQPAAESKASGQEMELVAAPSLPLAVIECSSREGSICALLRHNSAKVDPMQPALLGTAKFGELTVGLSLWWQSTRDGTRDYYSMSIQDSAKAKESLQRKEKPEPLAPAETLPVSPAIAGRPGLCLWRSIHA
jgi:hypothetical protein